LKVRLNTLFHASMQAYTSICIQLTEVDTPKHSIPCTRAGLHLRIRIQLTKVDNPEHSIQARMQANTSKSVSNIESGVKF